MKHNTPHKPYNGLICRVATQCVCPDTKQTGCFLFSGETHRNSGSRVTPVFSDLAELFGWASTNGFSRVCVGVDAPYVYMAPK